ncbi:MAG: hypothetical protein II191_01250 [Clostridia bacterium]|nr:hypothetical protein [Clostridia bacterium]
MKNSVYIGDIDPNNKIVSADTIRRQFMLQLLMWDSIVLSDSQFLTDPRINNLMRGTEDKPLLAKYDFAGVQPYQKGFEALVKGGLVEVACRKRGEKGFSLRGVWDEMSSRPGRKVPFLPEAPDYACYLDGLLADRSSVKYYDLDSIAARFKRNLLAGVDTAVKFDSKNDVDRELLRMFGEDTVYFGSILDFLKAEKGRRVSDERYDELYDFLYSCYSCNVSAETGCMVSTEAKNIPLHLDCGVGDFEANLDPSDVMELRPTWAVNSIFFDNVSFEDFVEMRGELERYFRDGRLIKFYTGCISREEWPEFRDFWEDYTGRLEDKMQLFLSRAQNEVKDSLMDRLVDDIDKFRGNPEQATLLLPSIELVKNTLAFLPVVGDLLDKIDFFKSIPETVTCLTSRKETVRLLHRDNELSAFFKSRAKIITKFN